MIEEKLSELEEQARLGKLISQMTATEGWREIFVPYLRKGKENAQQSWLTTFEHDEFIQSRTSYKVLEDVERFVVNLIALGEQAKEQLRKGHDLSVEERT